MRPVVITGGSGLLALNWAMARRDREPIVLGLHDRVIALAGTNVRRLDLESADAVTRWLDLLQPRVVVHTVAMTSVEACEADPARAEHVNVTLARNVARACHRANVALVHVSTDHLFRGDAAMAAESWPVDPVNAYGRTKAAAERAVADAAPDALIMRTNFFGWGTTYRRSFSDWIIRTLRAGEPVRMFADTFYSPILAESLAHAASELIDAGVNGIIHVAGDERISKLDFARALARQFDLDQDLIVEARSADRPDLVPRPADMSLSNARACAALGRALGTPGQYLARLQEQERTGHVAELETCDANLCHRR